MSRTVIATAEEALGARLASRLSENGLAAEVCASWPAVLVHAVRPETRLIVVDARLPGVSGPLLRQVAEAAGTRPLLRALRGEIPPLELLRDEGYLLDLVRSNAPRLLDELEDHYLRRSGLGPDPLALILHVARGTSSVYLEGERGSGKEWIARLVHRLSGRAGPFVIHQPEDRIEVHGATPGTLYVENADRCTEDRLDEIADYASATHWRLLAGSRQRWNPARPRPDWIRLHLTPLRERRQDIRPLASLYLSLWTKRLGLGRRSVNHAFWPFLEEYPWPGNQRELETFMIRAATSCRGTILSAATLPHNVLALIDPAQREAHATKAFEDVVTERLKPLVARHEPSREPTLYRLVMDATERALFRLVIERCAGNQKEAANLLGVARNTLRKRLERMAAEEGEEG